MSPTCTLILCILGLTTTFAMSMDTKSSFLEQIMGNSQELFILKLESDLGPEPEKLTEHGAIYCERS